MTRARCRWLMVVPPSFALPSLCALSSQAESPSQASSQPPASTASPELRQGAALPAPAPDRFTLVGQSETYFQLYRRALLPGANGASVPTETAAPIHQYLMANARGVDSPWQRDAISVEFAAWARFWPTSSSIERPFDGDVQTASVRLEAGPLWTSLGRQQVAGGAARYVRFDGLRVGAQHLGYFAEGYGGFTVLPRWNEHPGYQQLGDAEDELLVNPLPPLEREDQWLVGARAGYASLPLSASVSFHEQRRDAELDRRNLGLDVALRSLGMLSLGGTALLELDGQRLADARLWLDAAPHPRLDVGVELLHAEPASLLSRQSVLSVFSTDGYEELGGTVRVRALRWLRFDGNGYLDRYQGSELGGRAQLAARASLDELQPTMVRIAYSRVSAPENGYHSLRTSLSRQFSRDIGATLEAYGYFYDVNVAGHATSVLGSGTLAYRVLAPFELLWSGSLASSPYAALDAQTMLRANYRFEAAPGARRQ